MGRILIVDDDPFVRHFLHRLLLLQGHSCEEAENGEEAIQCLSVTAPGLIFADYELTAVNGMELREAIEAQGLRQSVPIVLLAEKDRSLADGQAIELGARTILRKPLDYRQVAAVVSSVFG